MRITLLVVVVCTAWSGHTFAQDVSPPLWENDRYFRNRLIHQLEDLSYSLMQDREALLVAEERVQAAGDALDEAVDAGWDAIDAAEEAAQRLEEATMKEKRLFFGALKDMKNEPEVQAARENLAQAIAQLRQVRDEILAPLQETNEYREADQAVERIRGKVREIPVTDVKRKVQRDTLLRELQRRNNELAAMRQEAYRASEPYVSAKESVREMRKSFIAARRSAQAGLRENDDRLAALKELEQAEQDAQVKAREARSAREMAYAAQDAYDRALEERRKIQSRIDYNEYLYAQTRSNLIGPRVHYGNRLLGGFQFRGFIAR